MAKKRKARARHDGPKEDEPQNSKLLINSYEDVADSEDDFHINRDKILLDEGPNAKRRRKIREEDEFLQPSEDEVLGFGQEDSDDEDDFDEDAAGGQIQDYDFEDAAEKDDEVGEEEEAWGMSKRDYYNADAIETEQDALDEEEEARRLQQKQLQRMNEADFGFDEADWMQDEEDGETDGADASGREVVTEKLPDIQVTEDMGAEERLKLLKARYPEFEPLSKEFVKLQGMHEDLALAASAATSMQRRRANSSKSNGSNGFKTPVALIKYQALSAYLAAMSMYFALLTSTAPSTSTSSSDPLPLAKAPTELRDHSIMDQLVKCRDLWARVEALRVPDLVEEPAPVPSLAAIAEEPDSTAPSDVQALTSVKKSRKTKAQQRAEAALRDAKSARAARVAETEASLADLDSLARAKKSRKASLPAPSKPTAIAQEPDTDSDLGEEPLTAEQAAEKAKQRRSLRFYTSQLAQTENRRGRRTEASGDADIPYRERLKDRQARLNAEAERRGAKKAKGAEALDANSDSSDEEDRRVAREVRDEAGDDEDDYYDFVKANKSAKQAKKSQQAADYAAAEKALRKGQRPSELERELGPDGKRAIGKVIEKNRGMAPSRNKKKKNPRVKQKERYSDKKKKLGSMKAIYNAEGKKQNYGGEASGIKTGLVKSVKF